MHVLVIDVETTGQNRFLHWMPCFAASVVDERGHCGIDAQFICYLQQPPNTTWDEYCCKRFWKNKKKAIDGVLLYDRLLADAEEHGQWEPGAGMSRFVGWLKRMVSRFPQLQVASDNPSYDIAWIDHHLQLYCPSAPSMAYCTGGWRAILDVRSYALAKGATLASDRRNHNPLCDAIQIGQEYVRLAR